MPTARPTSPPQPFRERARSPGHPRRPSPARSPTRRTRGRPITRTFHVEQVRCIAEGSGPPPQPNPTPSSFPGRPREKGHSPHVPRGTGSGASPAGRWRIRSPVWRAGLRRLLRDHQIRTRPTRTSQHRARGPAACSQSTGAQGPGTVRDQARSSGREAPALPSSADPAPLRPRRPSTRRRAPGDGCPARPVARPRRAPDDGTGHPTPGHSRRDPFTRSADVGSAPSPAPPPLPEPRARTPGALRSAHPPAGPAPDIQPVAGGPTTDRPGRRVTRCAPPVTGPRAHAAWSPVDSAAGSRGCPACTPGDRAAGSRGCALGTGPRTRAGLAPRRQGRVLTRCALPARRAACSPGRRARHRAENAP